MNYQTIQKVLLLCCFICATFSFSGCNLIGAAAEVAAIKLSFGCLPEGTRVDTPDEPIALEDLEVGDTLIGYSGKPVKLLQKHQYIEDPIQSRYYRITFNDNFVVNLSGKHRVAGIPAEQLRLGVSINGRTISNVEQFTGVRKSYDLLTEDAGYQIQGIPVNSMIEEMMHAVQK